MDVQKREALLQTLKTRFSANMRRHPQTVWNDVEQNLKTQPVKLRVLFAMEHSGGEPDVVSFSDFENEFVFCDCAAESPTGRRSLCYDRAALDARKENKPKGSAVETAAAMGAQLLNEQRYRELQSVGAFDLKTSSWIETPKAIRTLGGAVFCDRRYDQVFTYHNGADSYYAARGFRSILRV